MAVKTNGKVKVFTFGPGSMESLGLRVWADTPRSYLGGEARRIRARLDGRYHIDCGNVGGHVFEVSESLFVWSGETGDEAAAIDAHNGDEGAAYELAGLLLSYALEDYEGCDCDAAMWEDAA